MNKIKFFFLFPLLLSISYAYSQAPEGPIKVELKLENEGWQIYRGGKPYYINGVGGQSYLDKAVAYGAN
ncbi:MAG: hypothetical protein ACI8VT_003020, partial [Saprospiraceae bacterium]